MAPSDRMPDASSEQPDRLGIVPPGTPRWITAELIQTTIRVWQPYYQEMLSPEDALTMILTVGRLFETLSLERSHHETVRRAGAGEQ